MVQDGFDLIVLVVGEQECSSGVVTGGRLEAFVAQAACGGFDSITFGGRLSRGIHVENTVRQVAFGSGLGHPAGVGCGVGTAQLMVDVDDLDLQLPVLLQAGQSFHQQQAVAAAGDTHQESLRA